jgi:TolB protein
MEPGPGAGPPPTRRGLPSGRLLPSVAALIAAVVLVGGTIWLVSSSPASPGSGSPSTGAASSATAVASAASSDSSAPSASLGPSSTTLPGGPFASTGSIALVGNDGSLAIVEAGGHEVVLSPPGEAAFAFPAWSPDGSRLAVIRFASGGSGDTQILVFDATGALRGTPADPVVILRSSTIGPFYLSWTPDGQGISYLAEEAGGLSLRLAPADGSAPVDGSGPGSRIRSGNPFYYDWIDHDRVLVHVGTGTAAFLGEIGLDGAAAAAAKDTPGEFRPAVISHDHRYVSFVRARADGTAEVVVATRDGTAERSMPVFGTAAVTFDPVADVIASIGPNEAGQSTYAIPVGPLRTLDAKTGKARTLVDGMVVSFWWSPDGKTIAALRVQPIAGGSPSPSETPAPSVTPAAAASGSPVPSPAEPPSEVRLLFVDVAAGDIQSQAVVQPGRLFIDQFLTYFDQYALSHQLWAPDSSSLLLPIVDADGSTRLAVMHRNGDPPVMIEGAIGFWSP